LEPALDCYRLAIDSSGDCVGAHWGLGRALRAQGKTEDALPSYRRALELEPRNALIAAELSELAPP
ncbi:MAG: tetratricopeptide repeat protein, partial [Alphaproteobacteria bacterium]